MQLAAQICLRNAAACEREARCCDDKDERDVRALLLRIADDWRALASKEALARLEDHEGA
jgi:hypothetical protein